MGSAFQYKNWQDLPNTGTNFGDWFSDTFLGTKNQENKNNTALLNYQNQYNDYATDKANQFTEYMSSTEWQRGINDMLSAGINPMVLTSSNAGSAKAGGGSGAVLGSGSAKAVYNNSGILGKALGTIVDSALNKMGLNAKDSPSSALAMLKILG